MKHIQYDLLFLRGVGIASSKSIAGASCGTIALIIRIAEELCSTSQDVERTTCQWLPKKQFGTWWCCLRGTCLPFPRGIGLGLATTIQLATQLRVNCPTQIGSLFCEFLAWAIRTADQQTKHWQFRNLIFGLWGLLIACSITQIIPLHTPNTSGFSDDYGPINACAISLSGISGSFRLLLFDKYGLILNALKHSELGILAVLSTDGVIGLLGSSVLISRILLRCHENTLSLLAGGILGCLSKFGSWKQPSNPWASGYNSLTGNQNLVPCPFRVAYRQDLWMSQALLWASLGILLFMVVAKRTRNTKPTIAVRSWSLNQKLLTTTTSRPHYKLYSIRVQGKAMPDHPPSEAVL